MSEFISRTMSKAETDEWISPCSSIYPILPHITNFKTIWCPFDFEDSAFVRVLKENGHDVLYSHIETGQDFFNYVPEKEYDAIISNPPYSKRNEVLERCYLLNKPFMLLMNYSGLFDNRKRFNLFRDNGVELFILRGRTAFTRRSNGFTATPMFQSVYVCHDVFNEKIVYQCA